MRFFYVLVLLFVVNLQFAENVGIFFLIMVYRIIIFNCFSINIFREEMANLLLEIVLNVTQIKIQVNEIIDYLMSI